jgi:hypothetical protein
VVVERGSVLVLPQQGPQLAMKPETAHYVRLFNRLEAAVCRHIDDKPWNDEQDDQLHASYKAVLKDAAKGLKPK